MTDLSKVPTLDLQTELSRRVKDDWFDTYKKNEERKRGDCATLSGWDTANCCASCHDPGRYDTDLVERGTLTGNIRVCCHVDRWLETGDWHTR